MIKDSKVEEIKVLIEELNSASEAYYKYDRGGDGGGGCAHDDSQAVGLGGVDGAIDVGEVEDAAKIGRASLGKECRSRWSPYH